MKKRTSIVLMVACFVAFAVGISVIVYQCFMIKEISEKLQISTHECEKLRWENNLLKEGFFQSYNYEDVKINYLADVTNVQGETAKLKDIVSGKNYLSIFMQVGQSRECMYSNIEIAKKLQKEGLNVIVGLSGLGDSEFKAIVKQYKIGDIAYLLPNSFSSILDINPVVYFVIDKNLRSKYFYAPSMVYPDLTNDYTSLIERYVDLESIE